MAVMAREKWTDERLDDLNSRVEKGFEDVKGEVGELRTETKTEFRELRGELNARFSAMETRFNLIESRLDAIPRMLIIGLSGMTASIVGALLVTQL